MIALQELRFGNYILLKTGSKIARVPYGLQHLELLAKEGPSSLYPVVLKPDIVEKAGFTENRQYPLLPDAREFVLVLPVQGGSNNELHIFSKNNGECFGRATVNSAVASNNFYYLHQLQNIYYALTGKEMEIS